MVIKGHKCEDCAKFLVGTGPGRHECLGDSTKAVSPDGWCIEWEERPTVDAPPNGDYRELGLEIGALVEEKQAAYGDSFGKSGEVLRILYPNGIPAERLGDALAVARVVDKLFRVATDRDALGENPWRDVAGYALLAVARTEKEKEK